jgi:GntR family transcriptional regulator
MRIWLARNREIPLREQLVAQTVLAILCGDLRAGQRLPSTRELARRLRIHLNTVSAAYRELERDAWVESRRGSGVYVRTRSANQPLSPALALDRMIGEFFRRAREQGVPLSRLRARLRHWLELQPPDHFLLIEPDEELRRIVLAELQRALPVRVEAEGYDVFHQRDALASAVPLALPSKMETVRARLPEGTECLALQVRSVQESLAAWMPIPLDSLIAVASRWPDFLKWARTFLLAAGASPDALLIRDARRARWSDGLREARAVITDVCTAQQVPRGCRVIEFRVVADASLESLRHYARFLTGRAHPH